MTVVAVAGKTCLGGCGLWKPLAEFYKCTGGAAGRQPYCKPCFKARKRSYNAVHSDAISEHKREYRAANNDAIAATGARYYAAHRDAILARQREHDAANRNARNAYRREYRAAEKQAKREALADKVWAGVLVDDHAFRKSIL